MSGSVAGIGIIVHKSPFSNSSETVTIFTKDYGLKSGLLKGSRSKNKQTIEVGSLVSFEWFGREGSLGVFAISVEKAFLLLNISSRLKSLGILSCCDMVFGLLAVADPAEGLFFEFLNFLSSTDNSKLDALTEALFNFECKLLNNLGFGLHLEKCLINDVKQCSAEQNGYISPKTGYFVCKTHGEPYKSKLFKWPSQSIEQSLEMTLFFLQKFVTNSGKKTHPIELRKTLQTHINQILVSQKTLPIPTSIPKIL